MQDENVACHDIGKLSFERAVGCFGTPQLERAARFPMPQLERVTCFAMPQLELGFFYNKYYFLSQYAFHVYVLIVLIKA